MQIEFFRCTSRTVPQSFTWITSHGQLHCTKELRYISALLISVILSDSFSDRDSTSLQLNYAQRDTIDIYNNIRSHMIVHAYAVTLDCNLFCNLKCILLRMIPVNKTYSLMLLTDTLRYTGAEPEHIINILAGLHQRVKSST